MRKIALPAVLLCLPLFAQAHTGAGPAQDFSDGLRHPLYGLDHLLAMIAVGLWAAQAGGRALWAIPASFAGLMIVGGGLGMLHFPLPMVEAGILASVFLLGLLVAFAVRLPAWGGALLAGIFALFHGYAHGAEMPAAASGLSYAAGFLLATALLHLAGIALGIGLKKIPFAPALRVAGALVLLGGMFLTLR